MRLERGVARDLRATDVTEYAVIRNGRFAVTAM
jgi:hypothetical protein